MEGIKVENKDFYVINLVERHYNTRQNEIINKQTSTHVNSPHGV